MSRTPLSPQQAELSDRIFQTLRQAAEDDLRSIADLLASKEDRQLLGKTEFEVRDLVHRVGTKALDTALDERKKGVPGVQHDLPALSRGGPLRRVSTQALTAGAREIPTEVLPTPRTLVPRRSCSNRGSGTRTIVFDPDGCLVDTRRSTVDRIASGEVSQSHGPRGTFASLVAIISSALVG